MSDFTMQRRIAHLRDAVENASKPLLETSAELLEALLEIGDRVGALHVYQRLEARFPSDVRASARLRDLYERALWLDPADLATNVPTARHRLVGRGEELQALETIARSTRYVALTGPGGIGKTRLALELARHWVADFPNGSWWIDCGTLADASGLRAAIAHALKFSDRAYDDDALIDTLSELRAAIVFDGAENIAPILDAFCTRLVARAAHIFVCATSRVALGGATSFPLASLRLGSASTRAEAMQADAVRLFVERAVVADPRFALTDDNAGLVVRICRDLDAMPLAIEIAAAYLAHVGLAELSERLSERSLSDLAHTVARTIAWAYRFLPEPAAALLRRCSVFPTTWTLDDATALLAEHTERAREALDALVNASLVVAERDADMLTRYHVLDTTRTFARDELERSGESATTLARFVEHMDDYARTYQARLERADGRSPLELAASFDALAAAIDLGTAHDAHRGAAMRIAGTLGVQLGMLGFAAALAPRVRGLIASARATPLEAADAFERALRALGWLENRLGDYRTSLALNEELIERARARGNAADLARAQALAVVIYGNAGRHVDALAVATEALVSARSLGDVQTLSVACRGFAGAAISACRPHDALDALETFLALPETHIPRMQRAMGMVDYAEALHAVDRANEARVWSERAVQLARQIRDSGTLTHALVILGKIQLALGEAARGHASLREALALCHGSVHVVTMLFAFEEWIAACTRADQAESLALALGFVEHARERSGLRLSPERAPIAAAIAAGVRALAAPGDFDAWYARGAALGRPEALELLTGLRPIASSPPNPLTPREREVAELVGRGSSNREVSERLGLSLRTVENHLYAVYAKLGVKGRTQLAIRLSEDAI